MSVFSPKYLVCCCILTLFVLCIAADFYRNRDPYKAYFHARGDHYLTTHLIDSDFNDQCLELESRLSGKTSSSFANALQELYSGKQIILPNAYLLKRELVRRKTGKEPLIQQTVTQISDTDVPKLLKDGIYSFFYSPFSFSPLERNQLVTDTGSPKDHCLQYSSPWNKKKFPLLTVFLPPTSPNDPFIKAIQKGKYLFFLPAKHPVLKHAQ